MPLWFVGQQSPDELIKPAKRKSTMTQNLVCNEETPPSPPTQASRPQLFSALVAKYTLQDSIESHDDCLVGNEGDESNNYTSDNYTSVL